MIQVFITVLKMFPTLRQYKKKDLKAVSKLLACNKLKLSIAKCEFLLVGTRNRIRKIDKDLTVSLNGELLNRVNNTKYLGIVIDEFLDWGAHIRHMKSKITKCVYLLKRIRTYISQNDALVLYKTLIQCHLDYCDGVWNNTGKGYIERLVLNSRVAARCGASRWVGIFDYFYKMLCMVFLLFLSICLCVFGFFLQTQR